MTFYAEGELITVNAIDTSTELGGLDLDVHYTPDSTQSAQLSDPISARKQVTAVMSALLKMHPEMQGAFHGIWVHADHGTAHSSRWNYRWNRLLPLQPRRALRHANARNFRGGVKAALASSPKVLTKTSRM